MKTIFTPNIVEKMERVHAEMKKADFNRFKSSRRAKARAILAHRGGVSVKAIPIPSNSFTEQILAGKI